MAIGTSRKLVESNSNGFPKLKKKLNKQDRKTKKTDNPVVRPVRYIILGKTGLFCCDCIFVFKFYHIAYYSIHNELHLVVPDMETKLHG